jgi:AraC-like DNA-binding protein
VLQLYRDNAISVCCQSHQIMAKHTTAATRAYAIALHEAGVKWADIAAKTAMSIPELGRLFKNATALPATAPPTILVARPALDSTGGRPHPS